MKPLTKNIILLCRIVVGVTFIFSGFVKAVDPLGSTYKFVDYFNAFNIGWASGLALTLSFLQSAAEFAVGVAILFNLLIRFSSIIALAFMAIFTPLTLYIAIFNPVHDCGCFGEALVITNWQTFFKNIVLLAAAIVIYLYRNKTENKYSNIWQSAFCVIAIFAISFFEVHSYRHTQVLDFRAFKVGSSIPDKMSIPADAPTDVWESSFVYQKDGKKQEFSLSNLPDSTWEFVEAKHKLISKGYEPPITDFTITTLEGDDITDNILQNPRYVFLLVAYNLDKTELSCYNRMNQISSIAQSQGYPFFMLTASTDNAIERFVDAANPNFGICLADETMLKTIVRSNPGLMVLRDGVIVGKWNWRDVPPTKYFEGNILANSMEQQRQMATNFYTWALILLFAFIACICLLAAQNKNDK